MILIDQCNKNNFFVLDRLEAAREASATEDCDRTSGTHGSASGSMIPHSTCVRQHWLPNGNANLLEGTNKIKKETRTFV